MIAETPVIPGADVGSVKFFTKVGVVLFQQERGAEGPGMDAGSETRQALQHGSRHDELVEGAPLVSVFKRPLRLVPVPDTHEVE